MKVIYHLFQVPELNILLNIKQLFLSLKSLRKYNMKIEVLVYTNYTFSNEQKELINLLNIQVEYSLYSNLILDKSLSNYPPVTKWLTKKPTPPYLLVDTDTYFFSNPTKLLEKYSKETVYVRESAYIIEKIADQREKFIETHNCPRIFFSNTGVVLVNSDSLGTDRFYELFKAISSQIKIDIKEKNISKFPFTNEWILEEVAFDLTLFKLRVTPYIFDSQDILQGKETLTNNPKFISHYFSVNTKEYREKLKK